MADAELSELAYDNNCLIPVILCCSINKTKPENTAKQMHITMQYGVKTAQ